MAAPAYPPRPERQEWETMGPESKFLPGTHPKGTNSALNPPPGWEKWDRMGQIQSHFSRASFPLTLGQVPAPDLSGQMRLPRSRLDARPVPGIQSLRPPVIGAVMFVGV